MDNAVNNHLLQYSVDTTLPRFVASSSCRYLMPLSYPGSIDVGLAIDKLGHSSVSYQVGIFAEGASSAAAVGSFVHVYVDAGGKPTRIDQSARGALEGLVA